MPAAPSLENESSVVGDLGPQLRPGCRFFLTLCIIAPMYGVLLVLALGCGPEDGGPQEPTGAKAPVPPKTSAALKSAKKAGNSPEDGWGAVFWRQATAWKVGGGDVVVGPREAGSVRSSGDALVCQGVAVKGAPKGGALVLPEGSPVPEVRKSAAIQAHRVERAAWRLDEVLPARSKYAAKVPSTSPTQQRGIDVGSVTKTRRYGAPPFLIATGVRQCAGAVVFTDLKAEKTLAYDNLQNTCDALRVIPAADYDGDGQREFAVFNDDRVTAYRIVEAPGNLSLTRIGNWSCKGIE